MKDLKNNVAVVNALTPQLINSNTVTDGVTIDLQDYESCTFVIQAGTVTAGNIVPIIEESTTGAFSGEETAVADADLIGTEANATPDATGEVLTIGYIGQSRYVRLTLDSDGTTNLTVGAVCIKGHPLTKPDITNLNAG